MDYESNRPSHLQRNSTPGHVRVRTHPPAGVTAIGAAVSESAVWEVDTIQQEVLHSLWHAGDLARADIERTSVQSEKILAVRPIAVRNVASWRSFL